MALTYSQHALHTGNRMRRFFFERPRGGIVAQKNLLICSVLVLIPHLFQQRLLILAYCFVLLGWQLLILLNRARRPSRLGRIFLTLVALTLVFIQPQSMLNHNAGVELLLMMLCLKLSETNTVRDFTVTHGLCLFVLFTGFLYNSSIVMWAYSLLVIYALLASIKQTDSTQITSVNKLHLDRSIVKIIAMSLPLAAVMFILLPRPVGPLWSIPTPGGSATTGLTEQMSPGAISQLSDNNKVAFRVKFKGEAPNTGDMYWRGPVFTYFNGRTWREPPGYTAKNTRFNHPLKTAIAGKSATKHYDYQVLLTPHNRKWLFTLGSNDAAPANTHYSSTGQLLANHPITSTYVYQIKTSEYRRRRDAAEPYSWRYLHLPGVFGQRTRRLVAEFKQHLQDGRAHDEQMVQLVLEYFRQNDFSYTRKPPLLSKNPVDEFMFDSRAGFCEHYASAFAFIMREAGIPARIVTGYQGADYNPTQDYYIVRQSNAHAWTEVWLQHHGWTRVDPTTVIPPSRVDRTSITLRQEQQSQNLKHGSMLNHPLELLGYYIDAIDYQWGLKVVGFDMQTQHNLFDLMQFIPLLPVVLALITAILIPGIYYKLKTSKQQDSVNHYYQQFCHKLSRRGFNKAPYETATDFSRRVLRERPEWQTIIHPVTELYNQLRYSRTPPKGGIEQLRRQVRALGL